jgi:hypothetical protein
VDPGEPRDLPEIREEFLDLSLEIVDVALVPGHCPPRTRVGYGESMARIARLMLAAFGFLLYTWFAAVRSLPAVRARKAARRAR